VSLALLSESPLLHAARKKKITPAIRSFFIKFFEVEPYKIIAIQGCDGRTELLCCVNKW
jgi:hypothetical protein